MLKTPIDLAVVNATVHDGYSQGFNDVNPQWPELAMDVPFEAAGLVLGFLDQVPQLREFMDTRHVNDMAEQAYRVNPKVYEATIRVKISEINDGLIASKAKLAAALGEAAAMHPDKLVFGSLKANGICYDGKNYFSSEHAGVDENGNATVYSNDIAGSGPAWYIFKADSIIKPLVFGVRSGEGYTLSTVDSLTDSSVFMTDQILFGVRARVAAAYGPWQFGLRSKAELTKANVEAAIAQMASIRGDAGDPINNDPTVIVFGSELEAAARNIFSTERLANGASNTMFNRLKMIKSKFV